MIKGVWATVRIYYKQGYVQNSALVTGLASRCGARTRTCVCMQRGRYISITLTHSPLHLMGQLRPQRLLPELDALIIIRLCFWLDEWIAIVGCVTWL